MKYEFVAKLPVSLPVKEFWKSVNIWGSYGQEFSVLFFLRHSVYNGNFLLIFRWASEDHMARASSATTQVAITEIRPCG